MDPEQPEWEGKEDGYWIQGIPRDWPISGSKAEKEPFIGCPEPMTQKQWDNLAAKVLDDYNDGKISKNEMETKLKVHKLAKIK